MGREREEDEEEKSKKVSWVFSEVYGLTHKLKRICDACINAEKYYRHT